jgi:hypothetical protein
MESPVSAWITTMPIAIVNSTADWLYMEALQRYPLKISLSEGGIGWIPYFLERADFSFGQHKAWTHVDFGPGRKPSDLFRERFLTCFIDDAFGLANVDAIGEDNIAYECDYPHSDCLWPEAPEIFHKSVAHLSDRVINKVSHENALKWFNFDPFSKLGGKANCTVGALRKLAKHVDTREQSFGGPAPLQPGEKPRVVTSGDIMRMFMDVAKQDGKVEEKV